MIPVKIKRPIYIRKGPGRTFDALAAIYPSGKDIIMDGIEKGEYWKGIDDWYYKTNDKGEKQSYWAGGTQEKNFEDKVNDFILDPFNEIFFDVNDPHNQNKWKLSWGHVDLEIWKVWKDFQNQGEGVRVVVIDTGVLAQNNDLRGRISGLSISVVGNTIDDKHKQNHGTMSAGLIGADGANCNTVFGVAPKCELVVIKAANSLFFPGDLEKAVQKARALKPQIISLSTEDYNNNSSSLAKEIKLCKEDGIIVLVAAGDLGNEKTSFLSTYEGTISVGAYFLNEFKQPELYLRSNKNKTVAFLSPGNAIKTCSPNSTPVMYDATSASTAFAAGIIALAISSCKGIMINYETIINALASRKVTKKINEQNSLGEGAGILLPNNLIKQIQKMAL
jgi:subtilisin family serine protease